MATYTKYLNFTEQLGKGTMDMSTDVIKIALTNTLPVNTDVTFSVSVPVPAAVNGYTTGGEDVGAVWSEETGGVATLTPGNTPIEFKATAGGIGPFQYVVCYDSNVALDNLICWWPHTAEVTLADAETFTVTFPTVVFTNT
jgi:hypothetical protein